MPRPLLVLSHLGMGDMLVCCGLVRRLAAQRGVVTVVCKAVSAPSVQYMYRDVDNINLLVVNHDRDISPNFGGDPTLLRGLMSAGHDILLLGLHRGPLPSGSGFAAAFYEQAGVPPQARYDDFKLLRDGAVEARFANTTHEPYVFVHDDPERGFCIDLKAQVPIIHPGKADNRQGSDNVFSFVGLMQGAVELHLVDSCYSHLADLLDILPGRRYLHANVKNPTDRVEELFLKPGWIFVR